MLLRYFSGMDSLAYVVNKVLRHFFAAANISAISIGQITAQQREHQTMAATHRWHFAAQPHLPLRPAPGAVSHRHRLIVVLGHDAELSCPRDLLYQLPASAW